MIWTKNLTSYLEHNFCEYTTASVVIFTLENGLLCYGLNLARLDFENPKQNIFNAIVKYELNKQIVFLSLKK